VEGCAANGAPARPDAESPQSLRPAAARSPLPQSPIRVTHCLNSPNAHRTNRKLSRTKRKLRTYTPFELKTHAKLAPPTLFQPTSTHNILRIPPHSPRTIRKIPAGSRQRHQRELGDGTGGCCVACVSATAVPDDEQLAALHGGRTQQRVFSSEPVADVRFACRPCCTVRGLVAFGSV